jgi:rhodanese-related sulfurtransferase
MDSMRIENLTKLLEAPIRPIIIDLRPRDAFAAAPGVIPGAVHRDADAVDGWASDLELARPIVVYCAHGGETSQGVVKTLRGKGHPAQVLEGGFRAWEASGNAVGPKPGVPSQWVTRERPKIDRIACPWLIRRFLDPDARFIYVPGHDVLKVAKDSGAIPYDIPGVTFTHRGARCSFDAFIEDYRLTDPALARIADIVRGADTDRMDLAPQAAGLFAISLGLSVNIPDDHSMLRYGLVIYDALYSWMVAAQSETHNWPPAMKAAS